MSQRRIQQVTRRGVLHTLGLAGGTGGIKNEQGFFGAHLFGRTNAAGYFHQVFEPDVAILDAVGFRVGQGVVDVGLERDFLASANTLVSGNHHFRTAIDNPPSQRLGRETTEHHRVDRADPGTRQHGDHGFGNHRHIDGHHVAAMHILAAQGVGELADLLVQLAKGDIARVGRVVTFPDDRDLVATLGQMTVQAVPGSYRKRSRCRRQTI